MIVKPASLQKTLSGAFSFLLALVSGAGLGPSGAVGADAPYAGIWAIDLADCGAPPADPKSPLAMTKHGYNHYTTSCTFKTIEPDEERFKITADCTIDGAAKTSQLILAVAGNTLSFTDETGPREFLRCE